MPALGGAADTGTAVQMLVDRADIRDVMMRYASAVDRRDWVSLAECFADDVTTTGWGPTAFTGRDALVDFIKGVAFFHTTMHMMGNQFIGIDGDTATMDTYAMLTHDGVGPDGAPVDLYVTGGRYVERLARGQDRWVIVRRGGPPAWAPCAISAADVKDEAVRWLLHRAELNGLMANYALGIDLRDYDRIRSCFAPCFTAAYGTERFDDLETLIGFIRGVEHFASTSHFLGTQLIEVSGDTARMETYALIAHRPKPDAEGSDEWVAGPASYVDNLEFHEGGWRIVRRGPGAERVGHRPVHYPQSTDPVVQRLVDRAEIHDVTVTYALGVDRREPALVGSCFAPSFRMTVDGNTACDEASLLRCLTDTAWRPTSCHHFQNNQLIDISGDEAEVETYAFVMEKPTEQEPMSPWSSRPRRIIDKFVRHDGRWRIANRRVESTRVDEHSSTASDRGNR